MFVASSKSKSRNCSSHTGLLEIATLFFSIGDKADFLLNPLGIHFPAGADVSPFYLEIHHVKQIY